MISTKNQTGNHARNNERNQMNFAEFQKQFKAEAYDRYRVRMSFEKLSGGTPAAPDLIASWINSTNKERSAEERKALVDATIAELPELSGEKEEKSWVRFKRDDDGAYIEGRCLKAALKESANVVKTLVKVRGKNGEEEGAKALKSKVAECVFVEETKIPILNSDGKRVTGEIPSEDRPVHVMTRQGPRTSLKRSEVIHGARIEFSVLLAKTGAVSENALFSAIAYLEHLGVGADRSQGSGRSVEINVEKI